jgi:hypothetical protein
MMIKIRIRGSNGKEHQTTALIDCGASENFIDKAYAAANEIPTQRKTIPRRVLTVDGSEVTGGPVTHDAQVGMTVNHHTEDIRLHCITIGNAPVILGLPWLKLHNPTIDWRAHRLSFYSNKCAERCLTASPQATAVAEERATEQYYRKTPDTDERKDDPWEVCNTVMEKIKESEKEVPGKPEDIVPKDYHEFLGVFTSKEPTEPPPHRQQDHRIPLQPGATPPYEPLRPLSEDKMHALKDYIDTNEKRGWIRTSTSPAGAPIHFVKKKDGSLRLCVDYRRLNDITIKDRMPLPLIGESLDLLANATIYTKLDIKDAYHNLRIAKGEEWKTAFRTRYGLYEYCVMPFGLTNAPASFQRWINEILSEYLDIFCVAYLDDILVFSDSLDDHKRHVRTILAKVAEIGLTLKASKCEFHTTETEYLGYVISPKGLRMDEEKIRTIREWQEPRNIKGIQSFLGFANFYRRFIKDYSRITTPLTRLTRKDIPWEWGDRQQQAFDTLKEAMMTEPILQHFDPAKSVTIETDASDYAIGAVCSQPDKSGVLHPVAYYSRKLKDPERNYDIHDKELLAIVDALRKWDTYCKTTGPKIEILTDHKNLEYWKTKRDLNLRQARWGERLANYDFVIKYRPGKLAGKPDILSRESGDSPWEGEMKHRQNKERILLPAASFDTPQTPQASTTLGETPKTPETLEDGTTTTQAPTTANLAVTYTDDTTLETLEAFQLSTTQTVELQIDTELRDEIREKSNGDETIRGIREKLKNGVTRDGKIALGLCEEKDGLLTYDGLIWIPDDDELRIRILRDHHDSNAAGHPGRARTLELISRSFYWPHQRKYVNRYVDHCDTCKRIKPIRHAPFGLLKPLTPPHRPWDSISMDFITGLPTTEGCNALWVVVDRLTKMAHFVACNDTLKPEGLADSFVKNVVRPHGIPSSVISDRGTLFTSGFWENITKALGISRDLSTAFHPQTDGQTERVNATLEQYLRAYCNYQQDDWGNLLPIAEFCYNNTQAESTKVTPFFANYGYHPRFTPDLGMQDNEVPEVSEYAAALTRLHTELRAEMIQAQMAQAEQANKTRHPDPVLNPGDTVWLKRKNIRTTRPSGKLDHKQIGPYAILERVGSRAYKLDLPATVKLHPVFHISLLEPTTSTEPIPGHQQPPPPPVIINDQQEWEVEEIIDSRRHRNRIQYRVKWTGFHDPDKTWYSASNFENSPNAIRQFHERYPAKPSPTN